MTDLTQKLESSLSFARELNALKEQNKRLDELVRGARLLLNGDCPLSELNCNDWLRRADIALTNKVPA
jgi:hypothetical protein